MSNVGEVAHDTGIEARRIAGGLMLAVLSASALALFFTYIAPGQQQFAAASLSKRILLPGYYLMFAVLSVWPSRHGPLSDEKARYPLWWWWLLALLFVSTALAVLFPRQPFELLNVAQAVALFAGLLILSRLGLRSRDWPDEAKKRVLAAVVIGAVLGLVMGQSVHPFEALLAPGVATVLFLSVRRRRFAYFLGGAVMAVLLWRILGTAEPGSLAIQTAASLAFLLILALPAGLRPIAFIGGGVATLAAAWKSGLANVMMGQLDPTLDITVLHRAYEAKAVRWLVDESDLSFLFGVGPGATVDLSLSPDLDTLLASGRNVFAVDDVHLLTSYVYLKFGILGVLWILALLASVTLAGLRLLTQPRPDEFDVVLYLFVLAGVVSSIPAATHFFTNPVPALFLGVLITRQQRQRPEAVRAGRPSRSARTSTSRSRTRPVRG